MTNSIDNLLAGNTVLSGEAQRLASEELRRKRGGAGVLKSVETIVRSKSPLGEVWEGVKIGFELRREMAEKGMTAGVFFTILLLSVLKDFGDLVSLGTTGWLVNIAISTALFIVFFMQRSFIKRFLIKRFIFPVIIEFIPFLDFFPTYTIMAILLKLKLDKINRDLKNQLADLEKE